MWFMLLGVPTTIVWGIGIPVLGFIMLFKNRHRLDSWDAQKYLLMLYQGLRHKRYYWEVINTMRKALLLCVSAFLSTTSINYRALIATLILMGLLRVQQRLLPYKYLSINYLEFNEILTGTFTIVATLVFDEKNKNDTLNFLVFLILIIVNIRFAILWTYYMLAIFKKSKMVAKAMKCLGIFLYYKPDLEELTCPGMEPQSIPTEVKKVHHQKSKKKVEKRETEALIDRDSSKRDIDFSSSRYVDNREMNVSPFDQNEIQKQIDEWAKDIKLNNSRLDKSSILYDLNDNEKSHLDIEVEVSKKNK